MKRHVEEPSLSYNCPHASTSNWVGIDEADSEGSQQESTDFQCLLEFFPNLAEAK